MSSPAPPDVPTGTGGQVSCPICLSRLDWGDLPYYQFDSGLGRYVELEIPEQASPEQRNRLLRSAAVRCPNDGGNTAIHFLPAAYGKHGTPVVIGLIGASQSGKSHLLAAMVGAIEQGDLSRHGLRARPIDIGRHQQFLQQTVAPLLRESKMISTTRRGTIGFVDGFLISEEGGVPRPVALFDVAGGELTDVADAKRFLDVADGLIFVVDPETFDGAGLGDPTFSTVLGLLHASDRLADVSAAVVLNKADLLRFDDPIALWMRHEVLALDADALLRESADVYAYLHARGAHAWARPYVECGRATLHVVSGVGSAAYRIEDENNHYFERGVRPQRVLGPLISLMAMTGVITSSEAAKVGV